MTPPPVCSAAGAASTVSAIYSRGLPLVTSPATNPHSPAGKWILSTSALVAGMVHVGGITRLTKSGLSMTDWKPLGSFPPLSHEEWMYEFGRYRAFPEWEQRKSMTLEEFKYIYYWEWGHRMMGRFVGLVFGGGWAYFAWLHRPTTSPPNAAPTLAVLPKNILSAIPPPYNSRMALLMTMGGTQGLVGWWMVRSGLGDDRRGDRNEIRVSPYRLAAHLTLAASTYALLVWTGLGILSYPVDCYPSNINALAKGVAAPQVGANSALPLLQQYAKDLPPSALKHAQRTRLGVLSTVGLTGLTILSGAFVAGNDAGRAYNTYPLMDGRLVPWEEMVDKEKLPKWRNAFENTAAVQFEHRVLGTATALSAAGVASYGLLRGRGAATPQARRGLAALGMAAAAQMSLGVATLLNYVPISLAAGHQLGSLVVLTCGVYTAHSLRYATPSIVSRARMHAAGRVVNRGGRGGGEDIVQKGLAFVSRVVNVKI